MTAAGSVGVDAAASELPAFPSPFLRVSANDARFKFVAGPEQSVTGFRMRTVVEKKLDALTQSIREKPRWWEKVHSDEIAEKWRKEASAQGVGDDVISFAINQLLHLSGQCTEDGVRPSPVSLVFESDTTLAEGTREELLAALRCLEEVPDDEKDWHPGSNSQVLDLVHPSLFPLVAGLSRSIIVDSAQPAATHVQFDNWKSCMCAGDVVERVNLDEAHIFASERFQWLPSDVAVDSQGGVEILSYINNMHPEWHSQLYAATSALLQRSIPLFERVLAVAAAEKIRVIDPPDPYDNGVCERSKDNWIWAKLAEDPEIDEDDLQALWDSELPSGQPYREQFFKAPKVPETFVAPPAPHPAVLRGRTIQVIVKYASIVLTPEQPQYEGGSWHVEGMMNECIVASCIAYLRRENITASRLAFRSKVDGLAHDQDDATGLRLTYGFNPEDENFTLNENFGEVECREGRVVAFPNILQHRVQPFELVDATKPGLRTIAALFMVDPNKRITSTSDVPPQQISWHNHASGLHGMFSSEVNELIDAKRDFPVTLQRAKELRAELMKERTIQSTVESTYEDGYLRRHRGGWFEQQFNFCEH